MKKEMYGLNTRQQIQFEMLDNGEIFSNRLEISVNYILVIFRQLINLLFEYTMLKKRIFWKIYNLFFSFRWLNKKICRYLEIYLFAWKVKGEVSNKIYGFSTTLLMSWIWEKVKGCIVHNVLYTSYYLNSEREWLTFIYLNPSSFSTQAIIPEKHTISSQFIFHATLLTFGSWE